MTIKKGLPMEELLKDALLRERAAAVVATYTRVLKDLPTDINRYNVGRDIQRALTEQMADAIKGFAKGIANGGVYAIDLWKDVLVFNAVGSVFTDYLNEHVRPLAAEEDRKAQAAMIEAMTPAQREQYKKAQENPILRMFGGNAMDAVGEPGAGGSFDA